MGRKSALSFIRTLILIGLVSGLFYASPALAFDGNVGSLFSGFTSFMQSVVASARDTVDSLIDGTMFVPSTIITPIATALRHEVTSTAAAINSDSQSASQVDTQSIALPDGVTHAELDAVVSALRVELSPRTLIQSITTESSGSGISNQQLNRLQDRDEKNSKAVNDRIDTLDLSHLSGEFTGVVNGTSGSFDTLGIGTTSPSDTLAVDGTLYLADELAPPVTQDRLYNNNGDLYWAGNLIGGATTGVWSSDGTNVYRTSGNVGVGTAAPDQALDINGALALDGAFTNWILNKGYPAIYRTTNTGTDYPFNNAGNLVIQPRTSAARDIILAVSSNGGGTPTPGIVLKSSGRVGIGLGTTSPGATLHVAAVSGATNILQLAASPTATAGLVFTTSGNLGIGTTTPSAKLSLTGSGTGTGRLFALADSNNAEKLTILDNGNAGIGTSTPGSKLSVSGEMSIGADYAMAAPTNGLIIEGNVGIGTTSPGSNLHIYSDSGQPTITVERSQVGSASGAAIILRKSRGLGLPAQVGDLMGAYYYQMLNSAGTWVTSAQVTGVVLDPTSGSEDSAITFSTRLNGAYAERIRIDSSGNLGIGTTSPYSMLSVAGQIVGQNFVATSSTATSTIAGSLGVGTTVPEERLDVRGSGKTGMKLVGTGGTTIITNYARTYSVNNAATTLINSLWDGSNFVGYTDIVSYGGGGSNQYGNIRFFPATGGNNDFEAMRIAGQTGNVGIGTTSPATTLSVSGNGYLTGGLGVGLLNTTAGTVQTSGDATIGGVLNGTTASFSRFTISTTAISPTQDNARDLGAASLRFANIYGYNGNFSGNLGIGTTSPGARLAVRESTNDNTGGLMISASDGDTRAIFMDASGVLHFLGAGDASTDATLTAGGTWTNGSDRAFKENITDIKYGLADLLKLEPRNYDIKSNGEKQIGFIAQEMETVIPEVVSGEEGHKGIAYGNLTAVTVSAIKDLSTILGIQSSATTTALSSMRLDSIEARLTALEQNSQQSIVTDAIDGVQHLVSLVVDSLTVKHFRAEEGIEIPDQDTGAIYCVTIASGEFKKVEGECGAAQEPSTSSASDNTTLPPIEDARSSSTASSSESTATTTIDPSSNTSAPEKSADDSAPVQVDQPEELPPAESAEPSVSTERTTDSTTDSTGAPATQPASAGSDAVPSTTPIDPAPAP